VTRLNYLDPNPWGDYIPFFDCGVNGSGGGGYRDDVDTLQVFKNECLSEDPPNLSVVSFASPDTKAHAKDWTGYIEAIQTLDGYVGEIWNLIQAHPLMAGKTCLIVTTDHGRSDPDWWNHGGGSQSERRVPGWMIGPDIRSLEYHSTQSVSMTGFAPTIMHMLGMTKVEGTGVVMTDVLRD
jgi:bisphosphoglycerate-independent phosphoglycerate mutase (AlkP superfamily)